MRAQCLALRQAHEKCSVKVSCCSYRKSIEINLAAVG